MFLFITGYNVLRTLENTLSVLIDYFLISRYKYINNKMI